MQDYYAKRAREYEEIYNRDDPLRQQELKLIAGKLQEAVQNKNVIEVACGTGYWTTIASQTAKYITATDAVEEVQTIAKTKSFGCPVTFCTADAYNLPFEEKQFNAGLANFWFSHVPKENIPAFLKNFHRVLKPHATIVMADNVFVEGVGGKLIKKPKDKNTYKLRTLNNGEENLVLKNYFSPDDLISIFKQYDKTFSEKNIFYGKCFWQAIYKTALHEMNST